MLALRCAIYNGTFERIFEAYKRGPFRGMGVTFRKNYVMHPLKVYWSDQ
jgi:hypothetical protein